jgi:hypothetical protein
LFVILHICLKRYICGESVSHLYMASVSKILEPMSRWRRLEGWPVRYVLWSIQSPTPRIHTPCRSSSQRSN